MNEENLQRLEGDLSDHQPLLQAFELVRYASAHEVDNARLALSEYTSAIQCCLDHLPGIPESETQRQLESLVHDMVNHVEKLYCSLDRDHKHFPYFRPVVLHHEPDDEEDEWSNDSAPPSYEEAVRMKQQASEAAEGRPEHRHFRRLQHTFFNLRDRIGSVHAIKDFLYQYHHRPSLVNLLCMRIGRGLRVSIAKHMDHELVSSAMIDSELEVSYRFTTDGAYDESYGVTYQADDAFTFTEFAPFLFRSIRQRFGITCEDYLRSLASKIGDSYSITSMLAEGKSSSIFLMSTNERFIIKSLTWKEFEFCRHILKDYYHYVCEQTDTLLSRFYSLFQLYGERENEPQYFIVMENFIPSRQDVVRYDLKGSKTGRIATEEEKKYGGILKDLDFASFILSQSSLHSLAEQLQKDTQFLQDHSIMDYSLLVGVVPVSSAEIREEELMNRDLQESADTPDGTNQLARSTFHSSLRRGFPATYEDGSRYPEDYFLGIIDILQPYNVRKQVETALKRIQDHKENISCVDPSTYAQRFLQFITDNTSSIPLHDTSRKGEGPSGV